MLVFRDVSRYACSHAGGQNKSSRPVFFVGFPGQFDGFGGALELTTWETQFSTWKVPKKSLQHLGKETFRFWDQLKTYLVTKTLEIKHNEP